MEDLNHLTVAIAGGTGSVGQGLVRTFLNRRATVIVPCRTKKSGRKLLQNILDRHIRSGTLHLIFENISHEKGAEKIGQDIQKLFGPIDMAIASLGEWSQGVSLVDMEVEKWNQMLRNNLTTHFMAQRTFIPLLKASGCYVHINAMAAEKAIPTAGPLCMAAAAQKMMTKMLDHELQDSSIRIYELILGYMKTRERLLKKRCKDDWYTPEEVAEYITGLYLQRNPRGDELIHRLINK